MEKNRLEAFSDGVLAIIITINVISFVCQSSAIPMAYVHPAISGVLFAISAFIWLVPDKNIERAMGEE